MNNNIYKLMQNLLISIKINIYNFKQKSKTLINFIPMYSTHLQYFKDCLTFSCNLGFTLLKD